MAKRHLQTGRKYPPRVINMTGTVPDREGRYEWSEWGVVAVYSKPRFKGLFVTPPKGVEIRITERIVGRFRYLGPLEDK